MRVRTTIAGAGLSAMLTVTGFGATAVLASAAISACSTSGTPSPTPANTGTNGATTPATTPVSTPTVTTTTTVTSSPVVTSTPLATAPPATGGGGTAGIQHGLLLALGGTAVLAGAGSIAYRRKLLKNR